MSRRRASAKTMEAEPPDMRYQAEPGNEYNHLGLLYISENLDKFQEKFCVGSEYFSTETIESLTGWDYILSALVTVA